MFFLIGEGAKKYCLKLMLSGDEYQNLFITIYSNRSFNCANRGCNIFIVSTSSLADVAVSFTKVTPGGNPEVTQLPMGFSRKKKAKISNRM
jgi:hypothetical protein